VMGSLSVGSLQGLTVERECINSQGLTV